MSDLHQSREFIDILYPSLKQKSALSGRVGIGAQKRRTTITLNIKDTPKKKQPHIIEEEFAPEDGALSDLDFY